MVSPVAPVCRLAVVTLFPAMFEALRYGVIGRMWRQGQMELRCYNPRDYASNARGYIDDAPYGGGVGQVMQAPPILAAVRAARAALGEKAPVTLLAPHGHRWCHQRASRWLHDASDRVVICGRYEGIDQRVEDLVVDEVVSVGDYVLTGGELAAMAMIDSACRWVPGVVGSEQSVRQDSFVEGLLDFPHYTRPCEVENLTVPGILTSGDHARIEAWRHEQALRRTKKQRPDLLDDSKPSNEVDR